MRIEDIAAIVHLARENGLTHLKTSDIEISLGASQVSPVVSVSEQSAVKQSPSERILGIKSGVSVQANKLSGGNIVDSTIQHKVEEVASLMKLDPYELANTLFPDEHGVE